MSTTGSGHPSRSADFGAVPAGPLIRVLRGHPSAAELAALTAVVLARAAAGEDRAGAAASARAAAGWRRPERVRGFLGPRTWRTGAPAAPGR
ncbi:acyl-CoA carboxylase subunit epsilon [Streptomyces sp. NPDC018347]|uniref:acyl-CoA carboxylase subunit epsilon n=1 Tax=Streptomyces sp. NPDC018347 TaxID=3157193 RepID=UPI0033D72F18